MRVSKIASFATYHKCIKDLDAKGYIKYEPSYNPFKGSLVHIIDLTNELKTLKKESQIKKKMNNLLNLIINNLKTCLVQVMYKH